MRKNFVPSAWLLLCLLLIVFSDACLSAAQNALRAWWERVLPALFPFSVFLSLSNQAGLFSLLERICRPIAKKLHISDALLPCAMFGMLAGYPNGTRLCAMRMIPREAALCSFCSPMFLLGIIAHGLYASKTVFWPLFLAHVGSGVLVGLGYMFLNKQKKHAVKPQTSEEPHGFFPQLQHSMTIMASVGGCMVLFSIGISLIGELRLLSPFAVLLQPFSVQEQHLLALVHGIFEFAGGCVSIASIDLSLRIRIALTAFTVTFGGLCVLMQSAMFLDSKALKTYGLIKLVQGVLAAVLAYLLFPKFCSFDIAAMHSTDPSLQYAQNAFSMGSILLSSSIVLVCFYLFALALGKRMNERRIGR